MRKLIIILSAAALFALLLCKGPDFVAVWLAAGDEPVSSDAVILINDDLCRELPIAFDFLRNRMVEKILVVRRAPSLHQEACRRRYDFYDTRTLALHMAEIDEIPQENIFFSEHLKNDSDLPELISLFTEEYGLHSFIFITKPLQARRYGILLRNGLAETDIRVCIFYPEDRSKIRNSFVENRDFYNALFKETIYFLK